jgi:hypothetical protein
MDEARKSRRFFRRPKIRGQKGQAILEFMLVLLISLAFLRFVFFHRDYGFKAMLDKTMLRLGSHLENNLKSGSKPGGDGEKSLEAFVGTDRWNN